VGAEILGGKMNEYGNWGSDTVRWGLKYSEEIFLQRHFVTDELVLD
jgi:hypothetical protein